MKETLTQIQKRIDELMSNKEQFTVAIDGNCTAGKTTLANNLAELYDCNTFTLAQPVEVIPKKLNIIEGTTLKILLI